MTETTVGTCADRRNAGRVLRIFLGVVFCVFVVVVLIVAGFIVPEVKRVHKERAEMIALYPERDRDLFRNFAFPTQFFKEKAKRDGLTTQTQMRAAVTGYWGMETSATSDGSIDVFRFSNVLPGRDVKLAVHYDANKTVTGFGEPGMEKILLEQESNKASR